MRASCRSTRRDASWATSPGTAGATRASRLLAALGAGILLAFAAVAPASASVGSVPPEVQEYVADGSLLARIADLYGENAAGDGVDFDDTAKPGPISRVWTWTDARLAGEQTDQPVELTNTWVVPVLVGEEPVGLATIWINPDLELPELAMFETDVVAATALGSVPDAAQLVQDAPSGAWFALEAGTLTPLVPGASGVETPMPVDEVALLAPHDEAPPPADDSGLGLALGVVAILLLLIAGSLWLVARQERRAKPAEAPVEPAEPVESATETADLDDSPR